MKIISWNVNGLRATLKKGFLDFVKNENPDILCLQETKTDKALDIKIDNLDYVYWNFAEKKGYSGTVIFSKIKPINISYGINIKDHDNEGRIINLEFKDFFLINVYAPNSGRGLPRLDYRKKWDKDFLDYIKVLEKKKPIIICGDFNVAHKAIDLANPKPNYNKTAGYTQIEIDGFDNLINLGFIDTFREFHKETGNYTYWLPMFNSRARNVGWRIDYFLVSEKMRNELKDSFILNKVFGSDHCPVGILLA